MDHSSTNLFPDSSGNTYGIDKLFWCSLTSPRHTIYSGARNNVGKDQAFIGKLFEM